MAAGYGPRETSDLQTISRHHLECSICNERYQHPKILECLHSFCVQCLLKYMHYNTNQQDCTEIPCPVCRQKTRLPEMGVQGLKNNFNLVSMVEDVCATGKSGAFESQFCETCDGGKEATHCCLDCAKNICSHCRDIHLRYINELGHTITGLEDVRERKVALKPKQPKQQPNCPNHAGKAILFFCTTCEMMICDDCTVTDHCKPQHAYIDTNLVATKYKLSLAELFTPLEETSKELKESLHTGSRIKRQLGNTVDRIMREVQDKAAEIRAEVTAQENRLIDKIKNIQTDRDQIMAEYEKTMSLLSDRIQHSLETARYVTRTASDSDFMSLHPTISKDLKSLAAQSTPRIDCRISFLKFQQTEGVGDVNLGKVVTGGNWELCRKFGKKGSGPGAFNGARDIAARHQLDEIAVADCNNHRVVICSTEGKHKSTILTQGLPIAIASTLGNNRLIVVDHEATDVKVFNEDNTLAFQFPTVPPGKVGKTAVNLRSVAVKKDGTIIVGDVKRMVLTEHSPTDGSLKRTKPVKTKPYFLATDSVDRVIIAGSSQEVDVASLNGGKLFVIKPTIQGRAVKYCNGVYTDSSGIYVAVHGDGDTGHIHQYDTQGVFLSCIAQGLHSPRGITVTADGHLAVVDRYSVETYHKV